MPNRVGEVLILSGRSLATDGASDVEFRMVKTGNDSVAAFNTAVALVPRPHVISCSWGFDIPTGSILYNSLIFNCLEYLKE